MAYSCRSTGPVVVLEDTVPPLVSYSRVRRIKRLGSCRVYKVADVGEGVDYDACQSFINGTRADIDFDPDKDEVYIPIPLEKKPFPAILLKVFDNAGNCTDSG